MARLARVTPLEKRRVASGYRRQINEGYRLFNVWGASLAFMSVASFAAQWSLYPDNADACLAEDINYRFASSFYISTGLSLCWLVSTFKRP